MYRFLLNTEGFEGPFSQSIEWKSSEEWRGWAPPYMMDISPNGSTCACWRSLHNLTLFDFDRCSGLLDQKRQFSISGSEINGGGTFDLTFSPDSRFLYYHDADQIWQYDLEAGRPSIEPDVLEVSGFYIVQLRTADGIVAREKWVVY